MTNRCRARHVLYGRCLKVAGHDGLCRGVAGAAEGAQMQGKEGTWQRATRTSYLDQLIANQHSAGF